MEQLLPSWLRPRWVDDELKSDFQYNSNEYRIALTKEYERQRVKLAGVLADESAPGRDAELEALVAHMEDLGAQIAAIREQQVLVHRSDLLLTRTEQLAEASKILEMDRERVEEYDVELPQTPLRPASRRVNARSLLTALPPTPTALPPQRQ